jgi:hypothetical protein
MVANNKYLSTVRARFYGDINLTHEITVAFIYKNNVPTSEDEQHEWYSSYDICPNDL